MEKNTVCEYRLGDMLARYVRDENETCGFMLLPADRPIPDVKKECAVESLVQLKLTGDIYNEAYAGGVSLRNGESTRRLKYRGQDVSEDDKSITIRTTLSDDRGIACEHILVWRKASPYVRIKTAVSNEGDEPVSMELLSSFSLWGLSPYADGDSSERIRLYRLRSVWSGEGRLEETTPEELAIERSWALHAVRSERYGQVGSMPVNRFFPFGIVRDTVADVWWGAQIAHNASWQMEWYRKDDGLSFSGGLADREFGHWIKELRRGERFESPEAIVTAAASDTVDEVAARLTAAQYDVWCDGAPESERELPVIFNEYCTTWGNPSDENIRDILKAIRGWGISYFVIDCGWYKQPDIPWDQGMGDYEVSKELFPDGLKSTTDAIRDEGYVPGIWFEIDNVAKEAKAYQDTGHLLKRDGKPLSTYFRRFWDMSDPYVRDYLKERVIGTLKKYGFGYMKMDYNETIGIGCDGAESPGEGLRKNMEASADFVRLVKEEVPNIVLENCASGGHRLEPLMMGLCAMASFSDAHECIEIPIIAANLHRAIHPAQSQIWAVIRESDTVKRIVYSLSATFLGRMCISGDVTRLSDEQRSAITRGISMYKNCAHIIRDGKSARYGTDIVSMRHPRGWQAVVRSAKNEALIVIHTFGADKDGGFSVSVPVPKSVKIKEVYAAGEHDISLSDGALLVSLSEYEGMVVEISYTKTI